MHRRPGSMVARLLAASVASGVLALFLLLADPYPTDVLGQTAPTVSPPGAPTPTPPPGDASIAPGGTAVVGGITVVSQSSQPANVQVRGNVLVIAVPAGFTVLVEGAACAPVGGQANVVSCTVAPGARVTFTTVAGVTRQASPTAVVSPVPGTEGAGVAPAATPAIGAAVVAVPVAAPGGPGPTAGVQPSALPRTGIGDGQRAAHVTVVILAALALSAGFASAAAVVAVRRRTRA